MVCWDGGVVRASVETGRMVGIVLDVDERKAQVLSPLHCQC